MEIPRGLQRREIDAEQRKNDAQDQRRASENLFARRSCQTYPPVIERSIYYDAARICRDAYGVISRYGKQGEHMRRSAQPGQRAIILQKSA